jgi:hypothetical protein
MRRQKHHEQQTGHECEHVSWNETRIGIEIGEQHDDDGGDVYECEPCLEKKVC